MIYTEKTTQKRIEDEVKRLTALYAKIDKKKKSAVEGLIQRAAFMRISLQELETDLLTNGFVELFSQGDQEPYERKRPSADLYNTMNTSYQKITKQLTDLLPDETAKLPQNDGFDKFVNGRDDV